MPLLLTVPQMALAQLWTLSHVFSLQIKVNPGMERTELMLKLMLEMSLDTIDIRLRIIAAPRLTLYLVTKYLFLFLLCPHILEK